MWLILVERVRRDNESAVPAHCHLADRKNEVFICEQIHLPGRTWQQRRIEGCTFSRWPETRLYCCFVFSVIQIRQVLAEM